MSNAGYSGTPLIKKLGIKDGYRIALLNAPENYDDTLGTLPDSVDRLALDVGKLDFVQAFYTERTALEEDFPRLKAAIVKNGLLWISWAKKASKVKTDLSEDIIREIGLAHGLVDVKVAAIDKTWSGLKFVYRITDR
jgi:hypothetical protein